MLDNWVGGEKRLDGENNGKFFFAHHISFGRHICVDCPDKRSLKSG